MTKLIRGLLCVLAFGYISIRAFSAVDNSIGVFQTAAVHAGVVTDDNSLQCAGQPANKIIVTCPPYRAVPNDNQDDSKAFQAAVDALPRSGGTIVAPAGTYLFSNALLIQKPVHLVGAGPTTILTHSTNLSTDGQANFIRIGGAASTTEGVAISDLTMQGPEWSQLRTPMIRIVSNLKGVKIRNLSFRHVSSTCVLIYGDNIRDVEISDNRADEFYEQFVELSTGGISGVRIERNITKSTRGHPNLGSTEPFGVMFEPHAPGEISDVSIVGNSISFDGMSSAELINTGGISLSTGPAKGYAYRRVSILDNTIRSAGVGIRVQTLRSGGIGEPGSVKIVGNRVEGVKSYGILVNAGGDSAQRNAVSITKNVIRGYSAQAYYKYDGIRVEGSSVAPEIRGNQILPLTDGGTNSGRYGISIDSGVRNAAIKDNKIAGYHLGAISTSK